MRCTSFDIIEVRSEQIYLSVVCCLHLPRMTPSELAVALVHSLLRMIVATLHEFFSDARHPKSLNIYPPVSSFCTLIIFHSHILLDNKFLN